MELYDRVSLTNIREAVEQWEETTLQQTLAQTPERQPEFITASSVPIGRLYTPLDVAGMDYGQDLGLPGEYPFTRGVYEALGEFGKCGVAISSLADMEILFAGIPLGEVSTSMTINSPAAIIWAMYIVAAEKQGYQRQQLRGTLQNDILKEFIAQKEFLFPPDHSMRLVVDTIEFGTQQMPLWNTISISGYHIREAGSTAVQELAFTLADGLAYVDACVARGMKVDDFAPRLSFFFNAHNDFFEEIAKYRAGRRIWARILREKYGAQDPRSWMLRFHTQTAGVSLTAQQPENNIVRVAIQALAAVLGGTQSLHTNSMDEALALPSAKAVTIALRTQQVIAHESGVAHTIDPLAGSFFVEALTNETEAATLHTLKRIEALRSKAASCSVRLPRRPTAISKKLTATAARSWASTNSPTRKRQPSPFWRWIRRAMNASCSACTRCAAGATTRPPRTRCAVWPLPRVRPRST